MNAKQLIAAVAVFAAAGSAFAADPTGNFFEFSTAASTATRADVLAESAAYRAKFPKSTRGYDFPNDRAPTNFVATLTRAEVKAATRQAAVEGTLATPEFFDNAALTARAPVRAEGVKSASK